MKKLMIAAAVAMLGIAANAAKFDWSVDYTYIPGTTNAAEGWISYFFDNADVARVDMIAALGDNTFSSLLESGKAANDLTDSDGYADGSSLRTDYGNPETIQGYFVLFNNGEVDKATLAFVSELTPETTGATLGQNGTFIFGNVTATQTEDNWTAIAPEPTSGLLLLIGMAGLALKRKLA